MLSCRSFGAPLLLELKIAAVSVSVTNSMATKGLPPISGERYWREFPNSKTPMMKRGGMTQLWVAMEANAVEVLCELVENGDVEVASDAAKMSDFEVSEASEDELPAEDTATFEVVDSVAERLESVEKRTGEDIEAATSVLVEKLSAAVVNEDCLFGGGGSFS